MYLDTDIILALIKDKDWLKQYINLKKIKNLRTSVLTLVESELVLSREFGRSDIFKVNKVNDFKIKILTLDKKIFDLSNKLLKQYNINIFDSIHAAFCLNYKEKILSTDHIFDLVENLERIDPRNL